jgi:methionyl-tRNA synthetase
MDNTTLIEMSEFSRLDLRIGKIERAERIKGSKKLLRLEVDIRSETRQLVAGIAEDYKPEDLVGRLVAVVVNLKPAKLMGVESRGMILAVDVGGKPILLQPDKEVPAGSRVR